jgi:hypothetical protein
MIRLIFAFFASALVVMILGACSIDDSKPLTTKSSYGELPSTYTSPELTFEMITEQTEYPIAFEEIQFQVLNSGPATINFGTPYHLEKRENGTWYVVPFQEPMAFTAIGLTLAPKEIYQGKFEQDSFNYRFSSGEYRMIKSFHANDKEVVLAVVFQMK